MVRSACDTRDSIVYLSLWPILAFSLFLASDEIVADYPDNTPAVLFAPVTIFKMCVHMFALSTIMLAIAEAYVSYARIPNYLCHRPIYLEAQTMLACTSLVVVTTFDCLRPIVPSDWVGLSSEALCLCRLVPLVLIISVTSCQLVSVWRVTVPDTTARRAVVRP